MITAYPAPVASALLPFAPELTVSFWTTNTLSIQINGPQGQTDVQLDQPYAIVGSDSDCHVVINDSQIARRALLLLTTEQGLRAIVLSSHAKNPGRLIKVDPERPLKLHHFEISVRDETHGKENTHGAISDSNELPRCGSDANVQDAGVQDAGVQDATELDVSPAEQTNDGQNTIFAATWKQSSTRHFIQLPQSTPILLGRKEPARLLLDDNRLSGVHCCLIRTGNQLWIFDLLSKNGTMIDSESTQCSSIDTDKSFIAGSHRIHFVRLHTDALLDHVIDQQDSYEQKQLLLAESLVEQHLQVKANANRSSRQHLASLDEKNRELQQLRDTIAALHEEKEQMTSEQQQLADNNERLVTTESELRQELSQLADSREQLSQHLQELEQQAAELRSQANATDEEAQEALRDREQELERLRLELVTERRVLEQLRIDIQQPANRQAETPIDDETCISSFDFQEVLEEALESLPSVDPGRD